MTKFAKQQVPQRQNDDSVKKPYEGHEIAYRKMQKQGIRSWGQRVPTNSASKYQEIDTDDARFLTDTLAQPWAPKKGNVIELGCGTAPMLRWICRKNFKGLGVDVSKTAIKMARSQSKDYNVSFKQADLCKNAIAQTGTFDLCIDGHCLHCIISNEDRKAFLRNAYNLLNNKGLLIIMTMCSPVNRRKFSNLTSGQRVHKGIIYSPSEKANEFEGEHYFQNQPYMPTRRVPHWRTIISEVKDAGFHIQTINFNHFTTTDPCSCINLAAIKPS